MQPMTTICVIVVVTCIPDISDQTVEYKSVNIGLICDLLKKEIMQRVVHKSLIVVPCILPDGVPLNIHISV